MVADGTGTRVHVAEMSGAGDGVWFAGWEGGGWRGGGGRCEGEFAVTEGEEEDFGGGELHFEV